MISLSEYIVESLNGEKKNTINKFKSNMISLSEYIAESLNGEKKKKKSPVDRISKLRLIPSDIVNHLDDYNTEFKEWFKDNCEIEQTTLVDFAKYIPEDENIDDIDIAKWVSQNLDDMLGSETPAEPEKTDGNVAESKSKQVAKKGNILDGTPPRSAIFCHSTDDNEYYTVIWSRLDSNDENWIKLKDAYKYLKDKNKLDILTIAPYEII